MPVVSSIGLSFFGIWLLNELCQMPPISGGGFLAVLDNEYRGALALRFEPGPGVTLTDVRAAARTGLVADAIRRRGRRDGAKR